MSKRTGLQQRPARSAAKRPASDQVIDFQRYVPTVISRLSMKLRASAKAYFQEQYDITLLDWRILSFLASNGPASAYDIWTMGSLDKAAVSRALKSLDGRGLIGIRDVPNSSRRRTLVTLSKAGRQLHNRMFDDILIRHERLVGELSRQQIETFVKTAEYLETRISEMDKESKIPPSGYSPIKSTYEHE
jgi:DNA-binding MarR family transcriptional regulator